MTSVELTLDQWKNVMALLETGIKAIGFPAFETGGSLMAEIKKQIEDSIATSNEIPVEIDS